MNWYLAVLKKYVVFEGRAHRSEYWFYFLFHVIISTIFAVIDIAADNFDEERGTGLLGTIYALAVFLPSLAVTARRLHDSDRSGWWILIALVPCAGLIVLLVFLVQDSSYDANRFGPNPKGATA